MAFSLAGGAGAGLLPAGASPVEGHGLRCGDAWPELPHGEWHLLGPGIEPVSLALAGRFLTTRPPGKPRQVLKENKSQQMVNSF